MCSTLVLQWSIGQCFVPLCSLRPLCTGQWMGRSTVPRALQTRMFLLSAAVVPPATSKNCSVVVLCLRSYQLARSLSAAVELLATSKTAQLYSFKPKQRTKTHVPHLDSCLRCAFQLPASSQLVCSSGADYQVFFGHKHPHIRRQSSIVFCNSLDRAAVAFCAQTLLCISILYI